MTYNLQLKKFNMVSIPDDSVVIMIGKRNTGKSFLAKDFLYHHRDIPTGVVISGTEEANHFYSSIIPPIFIYDEFNPAIVANFIKRQKRMKKLKENGEVDIDERAFLIFDDLMDDAAAWIRDKNVRRVFVAGRHWSITYLNLLQYALGIPPNLRSNVDYIFILRETYICNRRRIYEHYAGMFPTFEMFCSVMDQCTENYECLVIHNGANSSKIEDQVFWYKAEDHGNFKLCPPEIWRYSEENYNDDEDIDNDEININTYGRNKKGPKLNVKKININSRGKTDIAPF